MLELKNDDALFVEIELDGRHSECILEDGLADEYIRKYNATAHDLIAFNNEPCPIQACLDANSINAKVISVGIVQKPWRFRRFTDWLAVQKENKGGTIYEG